MNKNCFAFKNKRCKVLERMVCARSACPFYKNIDEYEEGINKAYTRIAKLDKKAQKKISDKYYEGKMPWTR